MKTKHVDSIKILQKEITHTFYRTGGKSVIPDFYLCVQNQRKNNFSITLDDKNTIFVNLVHAG